MTNQNILAGRSPDGEIFLFDSRDRFIASYKDGAWTAHQEFQFGDLDENFDQLSDDNEVLLLMAEARKSLGASPPPTSG